MFFISLPKGFKIGDTVDCRINREPARVTWRDAGHLIIEPDDARAILAVEREADLISVPAATPARRLTTTKAKCRKAAQL